MKKQIGGILYYKSRGSKRICGTTIGADGSGSYALIIYGEIIEAETKAREIIHKLCQNETIEYVDFVSNEEGFFGSNIKEIEDGK